MPEMRILVIGASAPMFRLFWRPLLVCLRKNHFSVIVAGPEDSGDVPNQLCELGIKYKQLPIDRTGINPVNDFRYILALSRLMREEHPEVILSIAHKPIVYSAIAARWAKGPKIYALLCGLGYAFTDSNSGTLRYVLARFMLTRLYLLVRGYTAGLIYQNPDDERDILKSGLFTGDVRRMRMRGAGVMLERFKYIPYPHGNAFVFLLIARLLADKGIREYAKAAMRVRALYPNSEFHIVGSVDSNPTSVSLAEVQSWAKAGGIEYHGEQSDVRPYLARCHAYVLPSYREGTPQTSLEAMATGRAIITCDVPGCRETVFEAGTKDTEGLRFGLNGILCPPRDADALQSALIWSINNQEKLSAMGHASRGLAERYYEANNVANEVVNFINPIKYAEMNGRSKK